jgi:beta-lactamase superfamily II metal-dependent hydrolase
MSTEKISCICYFLDVGQGTSNIVYLGDGRAVVIDGGVSSGVPLQFLNRYVKAIEALVISHNDKDHQAGALDILLNFRGRVNDLYFLEDRPFVHIGLFALAEKILAEREIRIRRLERSHDPHILYRDSRSGTTLEILYPEYMDNYRARRGNRPNATSGVIALSRGHRVCLFPGDATIVAWRQIHTRLKGRPIRCDVLAVPHHGGVIGSDQTPRPRKGKARSARPSTAKQELEWLYKNAIQTDYAVISVGTDNTYGHPRAEVIDALRGGTPKSLDQPVVLCTQITERCCNALSLEQIQPGVLHPLFPSLAGTPGHPTVPRNRGGIACAGTIVAEIGKGFVAIKRIADHQERVDDLRKLEGGHPMCREPVTQVGSAISIRTGERRRRAD